MWAVGTWEGMEGGGIRIILAEDYIIELNEDTFELLLDDTEFIIELAIPQS